MATNVIPYISRLKSTEIAISGSSSNVYHFSTNTHCLVIFAGRTSALCGAYILAGAGSATTNIVVYAIAAASSITMTASGHNLTIANSNTSGTTMLVIGDIPCLTT